MEILILREIHTILIFTLFTQMVKAQQLDSVAQLVRALHAESQGHRFDFCQGPTYSCIFRSCFWLGLGGKRIKLHSKFQHLVL